MPNKMIKYCFLVLINSIQLVAQESAHFLSIDSNVYSLAKYQINSDKTLDLLEINKGFKRNDTMLFDDGSFILLDINSEIVKLSDIPEHMKELRKHLDLSESNIISELFSIYLSKLSYLFNLKTRYRIGLIFDYSGKITEFYFLNPLTSFDFEEYLMVSGFINSIKDIWSVCSQHAASVKIVKFFVL